MSKQTTTLALATKPNLIPKPTKSEIIEAMVKRAKAKLQADNAEAQKKREVIGAKIRKLAQKLAKSQKFVVNIHANAKNPHVDLYCYNVTSPEMDKLLAEFDACKTVNIDEKALRNQIRDEINGATKPDPDRLLSDPNTVKAIDAQLVAWGIN